MALPTSPAGTSAKATKPKTVSFQAIYSMTKGYFCWLSQRKAAGVSGGGLNAASTAEKNNCRSLPIRRSQGGLGIF